MMLTNFQLPAVGDIPAKDNEKGNAVSALPFAAGCHAECSGWGIGGAELKLKNGITLEATGTFTVSTNYLWVNKTTEQTFTATIQTVFS